MHLVSYQVHKYMTEDVMNHQKHKNTFKEVFSDIEMNRAVRILGYLEKSLPLKDDSVLYATGTTFKKKSDIDNVKDKCCIEIIKNESTKTGVKKIIPFPMPISFVIKILDYKLLRNIFKLLDDHLLIEFLVFDKKVEKNFLLEVKDTCFQFTTTSIKEDSRYLIYGIDLDNQESTTGIMELVSYGIDAPKELTSFL